MIDLRFYDELGTELERAAERAFEGRRRPRRSASRAVSISVGLVSVLVSVTVGVAALALLRHAHRSTSVAASNPVRFSALPAVPSLSPAEMHAVDWHWNTRPHVTPLGNACAIPAPPSVSSTQAHPGSPSLAMLNDYAVMRSPVTASNRLPASQRLGPWSGYGRIAQRRYGFRIEVVPQPFSQPVERPLTAACERAQLTALRTEMNGAPAALIATAVRIEQQNFTDERYTQEHPDGVCLIVGTGNCESFLDAQARGELATSQYGSHGSINADLVPNGVATITVHYPADHPKTPGPPPVQPLTITVPVIHNLAVWTVPNRSNLQRPNAITWLAGNGKIIRTTYPDA